MSNVINCIHREGLQEELGLIILLAIGLIAALIYLLCCNKQRLRIMCEQQNLLRASEARYRLIAQKTNDIIFEYDLCGDCIVYSENFDEQEYPGLCSGFKCGIDGNGVIHPDDLPLLQEALNRITQEQQRYTEATLRVKASTGDYLWYQVSLVCVMDDKVVPWRVVGRARDVDKQKRESEKLQEKASRDPLTKMLNKIATRKEIDKLLANGGERVDAFLIIDVDYFKQINDTRGHSTGDSVLTCAANGLRGLFRSTDILGRIGGDEMVVFCRDIGSVDHARQRAGEVCEMFCALCEQDGKSLCTSCSIGIAMAPRDGENFKSLYVNADMALYTAKADGRNRYAVYNPSMELRNVSLSEG